LATPLLAVLRGRSLTETSNDLKVTFNLAVLAVTGQHTSAGDDSPFDGWPACLDDVAAWLVAADNEQLPAARWPSGSRDGPCAY
jgi:hypothetical protein